MLKSLVIVISAIFVIGPISHSVYAQADTSKAYALLIDNTRSLEKRFDQVKLFSKRLVDEVHPRGPVRLFSFTWTRDASYFVIPYNVDRYESGNYDTAIASLGGDHRMEMIGTSQPTETKRLELDSHSVPLNSYYPI